MKFSNYSDQFNNSFYSQYYSQTFSFSQFVGIILAGTAFVLSIVVLLSLIIYQKYRLHANKFNSVRITSSNPCYISSSINQLNSSNGHAHCNMSVTSDFYDIDDINSLDNDSFLNSLENAIFVGYLNNTQPNLNASTVHRNHSINSNTHISLMYKQDSSKRSYKKSSTSRYSNSSVKLRTDKCRRNISSSTNYEDQMRIRAKSDTISESIGSTSNLITSSKMFLDDSIDSVCDTHEFNETLATESCETNVDHKTGSSTSVNSSSAMISNYIVEKSSNVHELPDLINSSVPRTSIPLKRVSNIFTNVMNQEVVSTQQIVQIVDPLRVHQNIHFINEESHVLIHHSRQDSPCNVSLIIPSVFEYNASK